MISVVAFFHIFLNHLYIFSGEQPFVFCLSFEFVLLVLSRVVLCNDKFTNTLFLITFLLIYSDAFWLNYYQHNYQEMIF